MLSSLSVVSLTSSDFVFRGVSSSSFSFDTEFLFDGDVGGGGGDGGDVGGGVGVGGVVVVGGVVGGGVVGGGVVCVKGNKNGVGFVSKDSAGVVDE